MDEIASILFVLGVFFVFMILIGYCLWRALVWIYRQTSGKPPPSNYTSLNLDNCPKCNSLLQPQSGLCVGCGWQRPGTATSEILREIGATQRQLQRLHKQGSISESAYQELIRALQLERERLTSPLSYASRQSTATSPSRIAERKPSEPQTDKSSPVTHDLLKTRSVVPTGTTHAVNNELKEEVRLAFDAFAEAPSIEPDERGPHGWIQEDTHRPRSKFEPVAPKTRRPFTEILAAFMEQSNIRWGEIIGGLLIIGCSTALVISLWNEISRIPLLKFFIFTSVTAALFGIGLYTEHRWKLPTTSRGILTIATLLVPLNFLAIAAVSSGPGPSGAVVLVSELIAPALFFCLVYFAGRIITPVWPHLLVFGVLGSSIGQLIERHFADAGIGPLRLVGLGLFPLICFVGASVWMLRKASRESEIDEGLANTIFVTLGASAFATLLSLGLLIFKVGQARDTMVHLAPLLTLGGGPITLTGLILWKRIQAKELAASRTAGTSIALIGAVLSLAGIALAFPNPASVVAASLTGFIIFTCLAIMFDQPRAHVFAAFCFALAFLVTGLVASGQVAWETSYRTSLVSDFYSIKSGVVLSQLFMLYLAASEVLNKRGHQSAGWHYMNASSIVGALCLVLVTRFGLGIAGDPHVVAPIFLVLALGAFYIARRRRQAWMCWISSGIVLLTLGQTLGPVLGVRFPWQAAFLAHATVASIAAIILSRYGEPLPGPLVSPLNKSALATSFFAVLAMNDAYRWEPTAMYAQRIFWLACVLLVLLWLNRSKLLFAAMQAALTCSIILAVKLGLQNFDWYAYQRNAWLHPWSLQTQGCVLLLLCLGWMALRIFVGRRVQSIGDEPDDPVDATRAGKNGRITDVAWTYLNSSRTTFDTALLWLVLVGFVLMGSYSALHGIKLELTIRGGAASVWNFVGFPHEHAFGSGAWVVLGLLLVSMFVALWQRRKFVYALGALISFYVAIPLLAARWETNFASASAWRWYSALFFLFLSCPFWWRTTLMHRLRAFGWPVVEHDTTSFVTRSRILLVALTTIPALTLTLYPTLKATVYSPIHRPSEGFFYFIGDVISYSLPLVLIGCVLIGHALRERAAGYAFVAGALFNLAITVAQLLAITSIAGPMSRQVLVQVIQLNIVASSGFALLWLATSGWWSGRFDEVQTDRVNGYLKIQVAIGLVIGALTIVPLVLSLCARPTLAGVAVAEAANVRGWIAIVLVFLAAFWFSRTIDRSIRAWLVFACSSATAALVAFTVSRWQAGTWSGYHALLASSVITGWLMLLAAKLPEIISRRAAARELGEVDAGGASILDAEWRWDATLFASISGVWIVMMALRAVPSDPSRPWWSVGALIATGALAAGLNYETLSRGYLYAAAFLLNIAASIWFTTYWDMFSSEHTQLEFVCVNIIALSIPSMCWLWLDLRARRVDKNRTSRVPALHRAAALLSLGMLAFAVYVTLTSELFWRTIPLKAWLPWLAVFSSTSLMTACLWDRHVKEAVFGLYLLGLIAIGYALSNFHLQADRLGWAIMMSMAFYAIATSFMWHLRDNLIDIAGRLGIPARSDTGLFGLNWLRVANAILAAAVIMIAFWAILWFASLPLRLGAAVAVGAQVLTFGLLAQGETRRAWQRVALSLLALGFVFFGWAWIAPGVAGPWLNRAVILMMTMFGMIALYGFGAEKAFARQSDWANAARSTIPGLATTGALALVFVLVTEVTQQTQYHRVRINFVALVIVAVTLLSASALCIYFAIKPEHDPLVLSESGRMKYVYVAEVLVALLFMHIRLTMPWLFTGFFAQYWPLVIVFIAFVGVGISEALRLQDVLVVSRPLERTGAFLPLLPVIGFWIIDSRVDYSLLLLVIGVLYASLSILRRSFAFGILAALAGNGGLLYMLHQTESYGLTHHPQLWIIPVAVSVLVAAYLNRESYTDEQMAAIRYVALMMIYVSSTSDILINGVTESPWLPLVLGGLSLVGVMCGIMFRVRAFLFLGATFLLIAIISMIWYASDNLGWTWLWWVAGIVTGALIIFTFALFEKKRGEMLQVLEDLRGWQK